MGRILGLSAAAILVIVGVVWTLQGLDYLGGSSMSGESTWAIIGPVVAGFGVALGFVVVRGNRT